MNPLLELHGVGKHFPTPGGRVEVLRGVSLQAGAGDFIAITGPSGAGKSTLLNLCAFLDRPSAGRVVFDGQAMDGANESEFCAVRKHRIGMVFQKYCLLPHRSVLENVLFRFRYIAHDRRDAVRRSREALATMSLDALADRPVRLLSGGEMQRVAIARAVAVAPKLLVADEPTGNLDAESATAVMECFRRLNTEYGLSILMVTHNESLLRYCSRHLTCHAGALGEAA